MATAANTPDPNAASDAQAPVPVTIVPAEVVLQPNAAKPLTEAPKGGRYKVDGVLVDANGDPIKDKGDK